MIRNTAKFALATAALTVLAACGNDPNTKAAGNIAKGIAQGLLAGKPSAEQAAAGAMTAESITTMLQATDKPVTAVIIEDRKASALMVRIGQNGHHDTYATSDGQNIVLNRGIATASRGLTGDLISSDITALQALVANRRAGTAPYTLRFLNGEERISEHTVNCDVTRGDKQQFNASEVSTSVQIMYAKCSHNRFDFTNTYLVDPTGFVVASQQWLGPVVGKTMISQLRK